VESFEFEHQSVTTQIEPHDQLVKLKVVKGEVGSSAMPHKVNPIHFENAMGNLEMANGLFDVFNRVLPISRLQRDLTDSTVLRNMGLAFGYCLQSYKSLLTGLGKSEPDEAAMLAELDAHPDVLAEAIQTVLRAAGVADGYALLKDLTRGQKITLESLRVFIGSLPLADHQKEVLTSLTPRAYIGLAEMLATE